MPRELRIAGPDRFDPVTVGDRIRLEVYVTEDGQEAINVPVRFSCPEVGFVKIGSKANSSAVATGTNGDATALVLIQASAAGNAFQVRADIFTGNGSETETVWFSVVVNP